MNIVDQEMVNIVVTLKVFRKQWAGFKILIRIDNEPLVAVFKFGRTKDPFLGVCVQNAWFMAAHSDIDLQHEYIRGIHNRTPNLLSHQTGSTTDQTELKTLVHNPIWLNVSMDYMGIDH